MFRSHGQVDNVLGPSKFNWNLRESQSTLVPGVRSIMGARVQPTHPQFPSLKGKVKVGEVPGASHTP